MYEWMLTVSTVPPIVTSTAMTSRDHTPAIFHAVQLLKNLEPVVSCVTSHLKTGTHAQKLILNYMLFLEQESWDSDVYTKVQESIDVRVPEQKEDNHQPGVQSKSGSGWPLSNRESEFTLALPPADAAAASEPSIASWEVVYYTNILNYWQILDIRRLPKHGPAWSIRHYS